MPLVIFRWSTTLILYTLLQTDNSLTALHMDDPIGIEDVVKRVIKRRKIRERELELVKHRVRLEVAKARVSPEAGAYVARVVGRLTPLLHQTRICNLVNWLLYKYQHHIDHNVFCETFRAMCWETEYEGAGFEGMVRCFVKAHASRLRLPLIQPCKGERRADVDVIEPEIVRVLTEHRMIEPCAAQALIVQLDRPVKEYVDNLTLTPYPHFYTKEKYERQIASIRILADCFGCDDETKAALLRPLRASLPDAEPYRRLGGSVG